MKKIQAWVTDEVYEILKHNGLAINKYINGLIERDSGVSNPKGNEKAAVKVPTHESGKVTEGVVYDIPSKKGIDFFPENPLVAQSHPTKTKRYCKKCSGFKEFKDGKCTICKS